jgi:hypothetical protein
MTNEPAGYRRVCTVKGVVARSTVMPVSSSAPTNLVAVRKSGWSDGRM